MGEDQEDDGKCCEVREIGDMNSTAHAAGDVHERAKKLDQRLPVTLEAR